MSLIPWSLTTTGSVYACFEAQKGNNNKALNEERPDSIGLNAVFYSRQNIYYATLNVKKVLTSTCT